MPSEKQWKNWHGDKTPKQVFEENWDTYSSNDSAYNTMYRAFKKCESALITAKEWGQEWVEKYIYNPANQVVQRIVKITKKIVNKVRTVVHKQIFSANPNILWNGQTPQEGNQFYLIELMRQMRDVVWAKIGTTTRNTTVRFNEHIGSKQPSSYTCAGIDSIRVIGVWDCGDIDPVEVESKVRSFLKKTYGEEHYIKNDRFDCEIDYEELKKKIPQVIKKLQEAEMV